MLHIHFHDAIAIDRGGRISRFLYIRFQYSQLLLASARLNYTGTWDSAAQDPLDQHSFVLAFLPMQLRVSYQAIVQSVDYNIRAQRTSFVISRHDSHFNGFELTFTMLGMCMCAVCKLD